ncbi:hypothetical protein RS130_07285 [Paraglaciecola aquimarina]|uniref:Uncharacterized protein n=1 Tax=Paraglaciecola aquimarina TaxID=1235557 RepID=A0ABU3SUT1_9ALTE|nr:hypothetical protein [Paraglaciecola aquimarina]MDU0353750.1 hypothetical protein [Paraglaciecola aquimarina]
MSKGYLNYYPETSCFPVGDREEILEKARHEAFVNMKLSGKSAWYFFGSLMLFFIPTATSINYFGHFSLSTLIVFSASLLSQFLLNRYFQSKLIRKGIKAALSNSSS